MQVLSGVTSNAALFCSYDDRIDKVETAIAAKLRDQLGTAKSANEMFNIFSRYNALFVRPHIRGAIKEYQSQLIQKVKDDIEGLHQKFKVNTLVQIHTVFTNCGNEFSVIMCLLLLGPICQELSFPDEHSS